MSQYALEDLKTAGVTEIGIIITRREDHRTCTVDESPTFPVHEYISIVLADTCPAVPT